MLIGFNKDQREGAARSLDTLATSSVIGAALGSTGHTEVTWMEVVALTVLSVVLYVAGFLTRRFK
jgi:hypothetical protein